MTDPFYLTSELKKYYLLDFEQVLLLHDPFWGIPEPFLRLVLSEINTSEDIQTLYSKLKKEDIEEDEESYLVIAYSKRCEQVLHKKLNQLASSLSKNQLIVEQLPPSENLNLGPENYDIGAINNPNYFKLHHVRITFLAENYETHCLFWQRIKQLLVNF